MLRTVARSAIRTPLTRSSLAARFYSNQKPADQKQDANPKKILDDDLLSAAGMDTEEPVDKKWEGAKRSREEQTTLERRARWNRWFYLLFGAGALGAAGYSVRPFDDDEAKLFGQRSDEWAPGAMWARGKARVWGTFDYFNEPAFEKLLPDPMPAPYGRPLTLVLSLDDLLVKSTWTKEHGWRTAKRPGVDYFLGYLAQYYELVIFSDKYQAFDQDIVLRLDPYRASISYSLFREATRFKDGKVIKDLNHLNRDLGKVIIVDTNADAVSLQPENALIMDKWEGKAGDKDLVRLIPLLEQIGAQAGIKDVRPVLKNYQGAGINVLDEYERRDQINRANWKNRQASGKNGGWASSLLGVAPRNPDMTPQDYIRQEGQKGYVQFQAYLKEHGDKMLEEEKQREKEIMEEHKMTLNKFVTQGGPSPEEIQETLVRKEKERAQN